jgi:vacuolar-type H+-ATPase subunit D/Vma8
MAGFALTPEGRRNCMADVMKVLKEERDTLKKRLTALENAIGALAGDAKKSVKRVSKTMSAAARKKISAAQKLRWAKLKKS